MAAGLRSVRGKGIDRLGFHAIFDNAESRNKKMATRGIAIVCKTYLEMAAGDGHLRRWRRPPPPEMVTERGGGRAVGRELN